MNLLLLEHDEDVENPNGFGSLRVVSFGQHHVDYADPSSIDPETVAYRLDYHEHGLCRWSRHGGVVDKWDGVSDAGVLVVNADYRGIWGSFTPEVRDALADAVLNEYTAWCNGDGWWYSLRIDDEVVDSCGGFIGWDNFVEAVEESVTYFVPAGEEIAVGGVGAPVADSAGLIGMWNGYPTRRAVRVTEWR